MNVGGVRNTDCIQERGHEMDALIIFIILLALFFAGWVFFAIAKAILTPSKTPTQQRGSDMTAEEEGNVHSGPYGYSPNTAYPQTQYGSGFDEDAEWHER